jgi:hypothetical protein
VPRFPFSGVKGLPLLALSAVTIAVVAIVLIAASGGSAGAEVNPLTASTVATPRLVESTALAPTGVPSVTVGAPLPVRPVSPGFLGISTEYYGIEWYGGSNLADLDHVFEQLVANLAPGQRPVLRIGGDSTDWLWLATPGVRKSPALKITIDSHTIAVLAAMVRALDAKVILGINLEADNLKLAEHLERALVGAIGAANVEALEIGNEPELYAVLGWYANAQGQPVLGRARGYSLADYTREFNTFAAHLPGEPLAGPATGSGAWGANLKGFVADANPRLKVVTVHGYPLKRCGTRPGLASYPTIARLLTPDSTLGLARSLISQVRAAHAAGKTIRLDEFNSVACFGLKGVSDTYASALWSLESSLQFARLGFDGLNVTTIPSAQYRIFVTGHGAGGWSAQVTPIYYGLLDFADSVPPGSRFLDTPDTGANPQVFALRTPTGQSRVVIVNTAGATRLAVHIPGTGGATATATALRGPSLSATSGVTLSGQSFGAETTTGRLTGQARGIAVRSVHGAYVVALAAHSATTLSVR